MHPARWHGLKLGRVNYAEAAVEEQFTHRRELSPTAAIGLYRSGLVLRAVAPSSEQRCQVAGTNFAIAVDIGRTSRIRPPGTQ